MADAEEVATRRRPLAGRPSPPSRPPGPAGPGGHQSGPTSWIKAAASLAVISAVALGLVVAAAVTRHRASRSDTGGIGVTSPVRSASWPANHPTNAVAAGTKVVTPAVASPHPPSFTPVAPSGPTLTNIPVGWVASLHDLNVDGLVRSYLMVRPPFRQGSSLPVVVVMHGRGMTPASMERASHLLPVMGQAIAVYPAGWGRSWNAGGCCGMAHHSEVDDLTFLTRVIGQVLVTQPDASASHVFLVGFSNGGRMAFHLACQDPGMFAGLAAVEAVPVAPCRHIMPMPTVIIASTGDPLLSIPVAGREKTMQGYLQPTVGATVRQWQLLDGCAMPAQTARSGIMASTVWSSCTGRGRLEYDLYRGGRHWWPQGTPATPSAQTMLGRFLWGSPPPPPPAT